MNTQLVRSAMIVVALIGAGATGAIAQSGNSVLGGAFFVRDIQANTSDNRMDGAIAVIPSGTIAISATGVEVHRARVSQPASLGRVVLRSTARADVTESSWSYPQSLGRLRMRGAGGRVPVFDYRTHAGEGEQLTAAYTAIELVSADGDVVAAYSFTHGEVVLTTRIRRNVIWTSSPPARGRDHPLAKRLSFATGVIGGTGEEECSGLVPMRDSGVIVVGRTSSVRFPDSPSVGVGTSRGGYDLFVARQRENGSAMWYTFIGGRDDESAGGVAFDGDEQLVVAGRTYSSNFPIVGTSHQSTKGDGGGDDGVLIAVSITGRVIWSTYMGGNGDDALTSIARRPAGGYIAVGRTLSTNLSTIGVPTSGARKAREDGMLVAVTDAGRILKLRFYGGAQDEVIADVASLGTTGFVIAGYTESTDLEARGTSAHRGDRDGFVARLDTSFGIIWSRYVGGRDQDEITSVAFDGLASVVVCGLTADTALSTTGPGIQRKYGGGSLDAFVGSTSVTGSSQWLTYLGGNQLDFGSVVEVNAAGDVLVIGVTESADIPSSIGPSGAFHGASDVVVARYKSSGERMYLSCFGGSGIESAGALASQSNGDVLIGCSSTSVNWPAAGMRIKSDSGAADVIIARLKVGTSLTTGCADIDDLAFGMLQIGERRTLVLRICNTGTAPLKFDSLRQRALQWSRQKFSVDTSDISRLERTPLAPGMCTEMRVTVQSFTEGEFRIVARLTSSGGGCKDSSAWSFEARRVATAAPYLIDPVSFSWSVRYDDLAGPCVAYALNALSVLRIEVVDVAGNLVSVLHDGRQQAGYHRVDLSTVTRTRGVLFLRALVGHEQYVTKIDCQR